MTPKEPLHDRVERWRKKLTPEWRISVSVSDDFLEDGAGAEVTIDALAHSAEIEFSGPLVEGKDEASLELVVVHELLHCVLFDAMHSRDEIENHVPESVWRVNRETCKRAEERAVDRLARAFLAETVPGSAAYGTSQP